MFVLRPYQKQCIDAILSVYESGQKIAEVKLPTGSGKTVIFAHIIRHLWQTQGVRTLILAHRDELLNQAAEKYRQIDPDCPLGKVGAGTYEFGRPVTLGSVQTVCRPARLEALVEHSIDFIVIDEAHHISSPSYQRILACFPEAKQLRVSATPYRLDGKIAFQLSQPTYSCDIYEMIKAGYLCNILAKEIKTDINIDNIHVRGGDFVEGELSGVVNTSKRNHLIVEKWQEYAPSRKTIAFCVTVSHAQDLCACFQEIGIPAAIVTGDTDPISRARLYQALDSGDLQILLNVMVLTEGFDLPSVDCILMARPTKSESLYVQAVGRGLRLAEGKKNCLILDISDNTEKHKEALRRAGTLFGIKMKNNETIFDSITRLAFDAIESLIRTIRSDYLNDYWIENEEILVVLYMQNIDGESEVSEFISRCDFHQYLYVNRHKLEIPRSPVRMQIYQTAMEIMETFLNYHYSHSSLLQCGHQMIDICVDYLKKRILKLLNPICTISKKGESRVSERVQDRDIEIFCEPKWFLNEHGYRVAIVDKHRIAIIPCGSLFQVCARLAPDFQAQHWSIPVSLSAALQIANEKIDHLYNGRRYLVDKLDLGRAVRKPTQRQLALLDKFKISYDATLSFAQASDLIEAKIQRLNYTKPKVPIS